MRLWSLHPQHLDAKGLVAPVARGAVGAKSVAGWDAGIPQPSPARPLPASARAIAAYLREVQHEATWRGYRFDASKIEPTSAVPQMSVTAGQIGYELAHLKAKLERRDHEALQRLVQYGQAARHPLFYEIEGGIEPWEVL